MEPRDPCRHTGVTGVARHLVQYVALSAKHIIGGLGCSTHLCVTRDTLTIVGEQIENENVCDSVWATLGKKTYRQRRGQFTTINPTRIGLNRLYTFS